MKKSTISLVAIAAMCLATACTSTPQLTSGKDYLSEYSDPAYLHTSSQIDSDVKRIAAIEPNLRFPARIGLARIDNRKLVNVPAEEGFLWADLASSLGPSYGEFIPISPLVAATVAVRETRHQVDLRELLANIRRGAARQHVDYVLIYEVTTQADGQPNILSLGDATVLGFFLLPSRGLDVEAASSALLLDVRNGYPYATITEYAEKDGVVRGFRKNAKRAALSEAASLKAVEALVEETKSVMGELAAQTVAKLRAEDETALGK